MPVTFTSTMPTYGDMWGYTYSSTSTTATGGNGAGYAGGTSTVMITTGTSTNMVWGAGGGTVYGAGGGGGGWSGWSTAVEPPARTAAEVEQARRDREEATRVWREQSRAVEIELLAAYVRAETLLLDWLTPGQAADYREHKRFDLVATSGRRWRVMCRGGQAGNVQLLDAAGEWVATYCAHPRGGLPDPDAWLAQRLQLLTDEPGFLRVANCQEFDESRYRAPTRGDVPDPLQVTGQRLRLFTRAAA